MKNDADELDELENWLPLGVAARSALSETAVCLTAHYPAPRAGTRDAIEEASRRWCTQARVITRKRRVEIR